jgi:hypothetical protein
MQIALFRKAVLVATRIAGCSNREAPVPVVFVNVEFQMDAQRTAGLISQCKTD